MVELDAAGTVTYLQIAAPAEAAASVGAPIASVVQAAEQAAATGASAGGSGTTGDAGAAAAAAGSRDANAAKGGRGGRMRRAPPALLDFVTIESPEKPAPKRWVYNAWAFPVPPACGTSALGMRPGSTCFFPLSLLQWQNGRIRGRWHPG